MRIGFYPGCSLNGTSREYNESVKALAQAMGLELIELKDWNCCGATAAHSMSKQLSLALPTRVLALAEQQGFQEIVVPCASCYNRLSVAQYELMHNEALKDEILTTVGMRYLGNVKILNVIQMIEKYMLDALKEKIVRPFAHQVACYYGCLLVRPHKILNFDRLEDPQSMDKIMSLIGATPIDWAFTPSRTPSPSPRERVKVVLPAPSSPDSSSRSPACSAGARASARARVCSGPLISRERTGEI